MKRDGGSKETQTEHGDTRQMTALRTRRYYLDTRISEIKQEIEKFSRERSSLTLRIKEAGNSPSSELQQARMRREYVASRIESLRQEQKSLYGDIKTIRQQVAVAMEARKAREASHA